MSFEDKMKRLTEITGLLEHEQLSLEEAAELYGEGMQLSAECHKILQEAVLSVQEMQVPSEGKRENDDGSKHTA
jgi:exodeoxyribonuclease VII small subunit